MVNRQIVVVVSARDERGALEIAKNIPGFTPDPKRIGPVDDSGFLGVGGEASAPIQETGQVIAVHGFCGTIDCCRQCRPISN